MVNNHFMLAQYFKTVQVVQLQGCFHKLFIASLLGNFTQNGGKPALLALIRGEGRVRVDELLPEVWHSWRGIVGT